MSDTLNILSPIAAILIFVLYIGIRYFRQKKIELSDIVVSILAAGMLPLAIAFTLYPFFPDLINSLEDMSLQITLTGLVLVYVYVRTIIERLFDSS